MPLVREDVFHCCLMLSVCNSEQDSVLLGNTVFIEVCVQIEKRSSLCCDECLFVTFSFRYMVNINCFLGFFSEILVKENAPFTDIVCVCVF